MRKPDAPKRAAWRGTTFLCLLGLGQAAHVAEAAPVTDVRFQNTGAAQSAVPVTFGQVFVAGEVRKNDVLVGRIDGASVPLQVDVKATHADGSVRHAVISTIVPRLAAGATATMTLETGGAAAARAAAPATPAALLATGFSASASATIDGTTYRASAERLLAAAPKTWLAGPLVNEWQVAAPLTSDAGVVHPHLQARFAVRYYGAQKKARVDVTVENAWAYEPNPRNIKYGAAVVVGGKTVYSQALTHFHHARWRKLFWWGGAAPALNVQANSKYLIASKAIPNYDPAVQVPEAALAAMRAQGEPMTIGLATAYMPTTGGRADIGILPGWAVIYALTMDARARAATLATADLAGSWSAHYRDRATDRPISVRAYPYMTIMGRATDTFNPRTKKMEAFPGCADCATPYTHDVSHQPSLAYLPYLLTGDFYYLEELQFWAMWNVLAQNPGYRGNEKGLVVPEQARGQAWALRSLAQAAYATPDADRLKADFVAILNDNLDWYNANYTNSPGANRLGAVVTGYALAYGNTGLAPWQDDFITAAVGHAADLGFAKAAPLLAWKARFPIARMTAPGACWLDATIYSMKVRDSETSPFYTTMAQAYRANHAPELVEMACNSPAMAARLGVKVGEMTGYSDGNMGYPSNLQPALAYAADVGGAPGKAAWTVFMNRSVKPDYGSAPQFAIVPRSFVAPIRTPAPVANVALARATLRAAPTRAGSWAKAGNENAAVTVPPNTIVRYGAGTAWIYATASGAFNATNSYFGADPAPGVVKTVEAFTPDGATPQRAPQAH